MAGAEDLHPVGNLAPTVPPAVLKRYTRQSQLDFELEFFAGVLERKPSYVDVLRVMGNNLTAKGEHRRSLEIDLQLAKLCPRDAITHYNLACSYSVLGMVEPAFAALRQALHLGYSEFDYLLEDRDLQRLRKDRRFVELLEEFGAIK
jgi:hypothetical protein